VQAYKYVKVVTELEFVQYLLLMSMRNARASNFAENLTSCKFAATKTWIDRDTYDNDPVLKPRPPTQLTRLRISLDANCNCSLAARPRGTWTWPCSRVAATTWRSYIGRLSYRIQRQQQKFRAGRRLPSAQGDTASDRRYDNGGPLTRDEHFDRPRRERLPSSSSSL